MPKISNIDKTPPIIEVFELIGLNGYKNLKLENQYCINIVAAENGSGKTTLLNALNAVLTLNFSWFADQDFKSLKIKFKGSVERSFNKGELFPKSLRIKSSKALVELEENGVNERRIRRCLAYIESNGFESFTASELFLNIYYGTPFGLDALEQVFKSAINEFPISPACSELTRVVERALEGFHVLYLPTFRRIESEFAQLTYRDKGKDNRLAYWDSENEDDYDEQLIWFGMNDVERKLEEFKEEIKSVTFESYSRISAQSLESLLSPASEGPKAIIRDDENFNNRLNLVLARLGHSGGETEAKILDLILSERINTSEYDDLRSHLHQIISIHATTQAKEQLLEGFVKVVNGYWNSSSSHMYKKPRPEKEFVFDKFELDVVVRNFYNDQELSLNDLSSGEKQIVAIFCKLYIQNDKNYIVLIDEPELSLAMAWQQMFLKDILESPSCAQLIAITHSPFIFDNELDVYAGALQISMAG